MRNIVFYFIAILLAIILTPIICFFALLTFLYDRHNPFYISPRVGKDGHLFNMIKLRSMVVGSDIVPTPDDDPHITPIGKIIRRLKLDELTQIFNVLKGDIHFVGPRPQIPLEAQKYTQEERKIFCIKPGITDIASIVFADQGDILKGAEDPYLLYLQIERPWKSRLALMYIEHASFILDLKIIFYTFTNIFARTWTLMQLAKLVSKWPSDVPDLPQIVARTKKLYAYPVPGFTKIIRHGYFKTHKRG